jgi:hypothetical protein
MKISKKTLFLTAFCFTWLSSLAHGTEDWQHLQKIDARSGIQISLDYIPGPLEHDQLSGAQMTRSVWLTLHGDGTFFCSDTKAYAMIGEALDFQVVELKKYTDSKSTCHFASELTPLTLQNWSCEKMGCGWVRRSYPIMIHWGAYWLQPAKDETSRVFSFDF